MKKNKPPIEKKLLLQILSVFAAIVLWFAITYTENPIITIPINNIKLTASGESALQQNNLILVNKNKLPNISIEVRGKRSDVNSILNSVTATVDLSDIKSPGEYTKDLNFDIPNSSVMVSKYKTSSITLKVENMVHSNVPIYIKQINSDKNKTYLVENICPTESISISGASADISKIKEALVTIDVASISSDFTAKYPISFANEHHGIITPENSVYASTSEMRVENKIYIRKYADIKLSPTLENPNYYIDVKGFSKENIEIGIRPDMQIHPDTLYAEFQSDFQLNSENKYKMKLILPDGIYCPTAEEELIMDANIEEIASQEVTLKVLPSNLSVGLTAEINPESVTAIMTGAKSNMEKVTATVDLSRLSAGKYNLPIIFETSNLGITIEGTHYIDVTIK